MHFSSRLDSLRSVVIWAKTSKGSSLYFPQFAPFCSPSVVWTSNSFDLDMLWLPLNKFPVGESILISWLNDNLTACTNTVLHRPLYEPLHSAVLRHPHVMVLDGPNTFVVSSRCRHTSRMSTVSPNTMSAYPPSTEGRFRYPIEPYASSLSRPRG